MNKKRLGKFIAVSSVFVLSTVTGIVIAGCDGCGKHVHNLTEVSAVEPTCTTDGRSTYYVCDGCELVFADAEGKTEIDVAETVKPKLNHNLEHHDADPATCTKPGNIEYWECTRGDGKFADAAGTKPVENVETTKDHNWGETGHHAQIDPTTDSEGVKEYWHCSECNLDYADEFGDRKVTLEELKIDKVSENIDGELTTEFYPTQNALTIGGADVLEGGKGLVINAKRAKDGVYLHIVVNYDVEATKQPAGRGKIGLYFNVRNTDNLNLPGGAGVCLEQAMLMELYLTGKVDYHKPYFLMEFETKTNKEGSKTKYTNTWEMFIPHSGFATVNDGAFAEAFEVAEGKTVLKAGYTYMLTAIGAMDATETFEASGESKCDIKDENTWAFWTNQGHGDWGTDQKYYVLGAQGITPNFQRATDTYAVEVNDYANATVTGLTDTVDYDKKLEGTVTVNEGYRLSGIRVNGQVFTFEKAADANTYAYEIAVSQLTNLKWNDAVLTVEVVVIKLDYQTVTVTMQGVAGGKTQNITNGTSVVIVSDFGDEYSATVGADGKAIFNGVLCQEYFVKIDGYVDGSLTVINGHSSAQATLEYRFAHNAGTRPDLVDLTDMNNANASITLGAQNVNGVDQNAISVQLNLSEEMKTAQAYVLYTTVTVNGDVSESKQNTWLQRFGIRFAAGDVNNTYNNKFVIWWDDLGLNSNPSAIWANDATSCGGGGDRRATFDWLASSVLDGLQLKVVRNGSFVTVSAFNLDDEQWYTLLSGTTSATAENDITFYVSGESFTFSEISFEKLNVVSLKLPSGNTDGIKGHLTSSKGDVFTLSGILTSEDELSIPAGSIAYTEYDNVEIENGLGLITIAGNGIADRNTHSYNHATYILPEAVRGEKEISLSFNIKDINESQETDAWAARRFGIQIGKGAYGLYFWTPNGDEFNIIKLVEGTLDMNTDREGMDIAKANWAAPIIRSSDGLDVQIVRIGGRIVVNLKNSDGAWVRIGEMNCPESVETEIKFVGGGDTWEVSGISVVTVEYVPAEEATTEKDGNIAYYTDGTNYYNQDGTVTDAEAVVIPQIVEREVAITVEVYGTDGNKIQTPDLSGVKITLTGEYDYNKNVYTELAVGADYGLTLENGKIYAGTYSVTANGYAVDAITIGKDAQTASIALHQIASYQIMEATKTYKPESVTTGFNANGVTVKLTGCKTDDWAEYNTPVPEATLTLPAGLATSKNISVEFNLKLSNQGFWGANAFGISVVKDYGGFILRTFASDGPETDISELYAQKLCENDMKLLGKNAWVKGAMVGAGGLNVRVVRVGTVITLYAQNSEGDYEKLYGISCAADAETEVKFMGAASDFEISRIVVCTAPAAFATPDGSIKVSEDIVYHEYVAPSESNDYIGNIEYYTVGNVYYLPDGTKTTAEEVVISEVNVFVTVNAVDKEGNTVELADGTQITLTGACKNYTFTVGGSLEKMIPGEYEAYLYGYAYAEVVVPDAGGEVEIMLVKTFAYTTVGTHGGQSGVEVDGTTVTIKGNGLADDNKTWAGKAEIVLSDELQNSNSVALTFTLKDTHSPQGGWDWAARRFGVTMQGENGGFMCFTANEPEGAFFVMGTDPSKEDGRITFNQIGSLVRSQNGVNMRVARVSDKVLMYVQIDEMWVKIGSFDCNAAGNTKIVLYGEGDTWQFSNIVVAEYTAADATVTKGDLPQGVTLELSAQTVAKDGTVTATLTGGANYLVSVNGKEFSVGSSFEIAYNDYVLGLADPEITVAVLKVSDTSAEISRGELGSNKTIDLSQSELDGKTLLDWNLYKKGECVTKDDATVWETTGMDGLADGGGDYDNPNAITFKTSGSGAAEGTFFCMGGGNYQAHSSVTVKVSKGATQINLYTGSWQSNNSVKFSVKIGDFVLSTQSYVFGNDRRSELVTIAIDTSKWENNEVKDIVIEIEPATQGYMLAAIAVLGGTVSD